MAKTNTCDICGKISTDPMREDLARTMDYCEGCWEKLPHATYGMDINWPRIAKYYINNVGVKPDNQWKL